MATIVFTYKGASARLTELDDGSYLLRDVFSESRRQGHARQVMQQVTDFADSKNATIVLTVQRFGKPGPLDLTNTQLEAFYTIFGFVRDDRFARLPQRMIRRNYMLHSEKEQ